METPSFPHIIVMGNEKGGSGKSTTTMHLAIALLRDGWRVGTIDLDGQQATLTRYFENRLQYLDRHHIELPMPTHFSIAQARGEGVEKNRDEEFGALKTALERLEKTCEIIIIDTPGSENHLMRMGHMMANTVVTPVNDSFLDLDVLGTLDAETLKFEKYGSYARMATKCRERQMNAHGKAFNWIVMRNRLSPLQANNMVRVSNTLKLLSATLDFELIDGLHERVIFRELFPSGLTLLDTVEQAPKSKITMSHVAARREIRNLVQALNLPACPDKSKTGSLTGRKVLTKDTLVSNIS